VSSDSQTSDNVEVDNKCRPVKTAYPISCVNIILQDKRISFPVKAVGVRNYANSQNSTVDIDITGIMSNSFMYMLKEAWKQERIEVMERPVIKYHVMDIDKSLDNILRIQHEREQDRKNKRNLN